MLQYKHTALWGACRGGHVEGGSRVGGGYVGGHEY